MVFVIYMSMILFLGVVLYGVAEILDGILDTISNKKLQHLSTAMSQNDMKSLSETQKQIVEEYMRNSYRPITYGEFNDLVTHQEQVASLKQ